MPSFAPGPHRPFQWNMPQNDTPPMPQRRGFPPLFPRASSEELPPATPSVPRSGTGIGEWITSLLSVAQNGSGENLNIAGVIANAQKAVQTVQTILPMVDQFAPLVKNAPAIMSVLKGLQNSTASTDNKPKQDSQEDSKETQHTQNTDKDTAQINDENEMLEKSQASSEKNKKEVGTWSPLTLLSLSESEELPVKPSVPRLYI